jgi:hypothetical protein
MVLRDTLRQPLVTLAAAKTRVGNGSGAPNEEGAGCGGGGFSVLSGKQGANLGVR